MFGLAFNALSDAATLLHVALSLIFIPIGSLLCFRGFHYQSFVAFTCTSVLAGVNAFCVLTLHIDFATVPLLISLCFAIICGAFSILIDWAIAGCVLGYTLAVLLFIVSGFHGFETPASRVVTFLALIVVCIAVAYKSPRSIYVLLSSLWGSAALAITADFWFSDGSLVTILSAALFRSETATHCSSASCTGISIAWSIIMCTALLIQSWYSYQEYSSEKLAALSSKPVNILPHRTLGGTGRVMSWDDVHIKQQSATSASRAEFNYFEIGNRLLPMDQNGDSAELTASLQSAFNKVARQFGFQIDSVINQSEHVCMLLANSKRAPIESWDQALVALHLRSFGNYGLWCSHMGVAPEVCSDLLDFVCSDSMINASNSSAAFSAAASQQFYFNSPTTLQRACSDIALFYCIWGEAANLRLVPEALCFLFHKMSSELSRADQLSVEPVRAVGAFLSCVVQPLYKVISSPGADVSGLKRNYDDMNEFFWSRACLRCTYFTASEDVGYFPSVGLHSEDVQHFVSFDSTADLNSPRFSSRSEEDAVSQAAAHAASFGEYPVAVSPMLPRGKHARSSQPSNTEHGTLRNPLHGALSLTRRLEAPSVSESLGQASKTFLEKRSWLASARAFSRLVSFYFSAFELLVCIAFLNHYKIDFDSHRHQWVHVLCSVVLTVNVMTIFGELLEIWGSVEIMRRHLYDLISCTTRLLIKSASFAVLAVLYTWSWERPQDVVQWLGWTWTFLDVYLLCACFFALPYVFFIASAMFPSISIFARNGLTWRPWQAFRRFWWPATRTFVGKNMLVTERLSWRYQLFWIALLSIKFWCSYEFQVKPLVAPTIELLFKEPLDSNPLFPGFNLILVPLLWLPFIFVYSLDAQIWYAIWTAIVGAAVGMASRLGEVADFSILSERILDAPRLFVSRILTRDDPESTDLKVVSVSDQPSLEPLLQGSSSSVLVQHMMFHNEKWHAFAVAWNDIIDGMRGGDLLNNSERDLLLFRFFSTSESPNQSSPVSERPYYLPLFLMAGSIDDALSKMSQLGSRFRALQADAVGEAAEQLHSFANYFVSTKPRRALMLESLVELWELSQWLVLGLLGDRHAAEMRCIVSLLTSYSASGKLLSKVTVENLESVKVALLDLIRIMRIARTTYKKRSQQSDNKADIAVKVTEKATSNQVVSELSGLRKIPSIHTLSLMEKFSGTSLSAVPQPLPASASQFVETDKDLSMIRERLEKLLNTVANVLRDDKKEVTLRFKTMLAQPNGFFWDASYATGHVLKLVNQPSCALILESMYVQLTVAKLDAQPSSVDASRRLLFFMNSLFMQMPRAPAVDSMKSLSVLTPFYSEDVAYSNADLLKENEDGVSNMSYLQSIYPVQWRNFLERVGELDTDRSLILNSSKGDEARKWASHRGQTLSRTVNGMMLYQRALKLLAELERPSYLPPGLSLSSLDTLSSQLVCKFSYVVACQVYGQQKKNGDRQAADIDALLMAHPNLRVAYIDSTHVNTSDELGNPIVKNDFYSVLVKAVPDSNGNFNQIREVYRVKLPGNPIVGEGKPENQNHSIIFTRGEYLQTIDMNQENYIEEAFKLKNLLQEFDQNEQPSIVGYREHIFTGSLSSIANYMALQEGSFVTQGQRVLANPLAMRFHYGHPDVFDKLYFVSRGGVSKASRGVNLSEDIFAGFNSMLRGSAAGSSMHEYVQCGKGRDVGLQQLFKFEAKLSQGAAEQTLTRDVYRLAQNLDFFRLLSFYCGGVGFYIGNCLTVWAVFLFLYSKLFLTLFKLDDKIALFSGTQSLSYWFGQVGFMLTLPIFTGLGIERGFYAATVEVLQMLLTGGPLYFTFMIGTKFYYFSQTILVGGSKYRPTGRGFLTSHESFAEVYRFHAASHFYAFVEVFLGLLIYAFWTTQDGTYSAETWSLWILAVAWGFSPFWFNPLAFEYDKIRADIADWTNWMARTEGDLQRSYRSWWLDEFAYYHDLTLTQRLMQVLLSTRFLLIGIGLLYLRDTSALEISLCVAFLVGIVCCFLLMRIDFCHHNRCAQRAFNVVCIFLTITLVVVLITSVRLPADAVQSVLQTMLGLAYIIGFITNVPIIFGRQWAVVLWMCKFYDFCIGILLLTPQVILSLLYIPTVIQTRLMFNNAFSRGVIIEDLLRGKKGAVATSGTAPSVDMRTTMSRIDQLQSLVDQQADALRQQRITLDALSQVTHTLPSKSLASDRVFQQHQRVKIDRTQPSALPPISASPSPVSTLESNMRGKEYTWGAADQRPIPETTDVHSISSPLAKKI